MVNFTATAAAIAPDLASRVMRLLPREFQEAFVQSPNVFMFFMSMGLPGSNVDEHSMQNGFHSP